MKQVKYLGAIIAICVLCTFVSSMSFVSATTVEDGDVIRVGYYEDFLEFAEDINSFNNKGYGVDIFEKISEVSDLEFEYIPISDDPTDALNNGEVDLLAFHTRSQERAEDTIYSQMEYGKAYVSILSKDMDIAYGDFDALDGKTIATYSENIGNERLEFLGENLGFSMEYVYGEAHDYMDLDADFYLAFSGHRSIGELNNVLDVGVYNLYINASIENQELIDKLDAILYDIVVTEGNFFLELEEKYLADNVEITHRGLMPNEIETLRQRTLEVGYITGFAPISFMNEQGQPDGAMVETFSYFADRYGFEVNYHPYSISDPPESHENFDILVTLYGDGDHEWEHYVATEPYYLIPMYAQVNIDRLGTIALEEILAKSPEIGILPYQTVDLGPFNDAFPDVEIIYYNDWFELLDDFDAGNLDMLMSTESAVTFAEIYLDEVNSASIRTDSEIPMQYFINKDIADEYLPIFNVMLDRMSEREYEAILETNSNEILPSQEMSVWDFFKANWYYFAIIVIAGLALFAGYEYKKQKEKQEALAIAYNTDALTGLIAIHQFNKVMDETLAKARPKEYELISFDVDVFKTINTHFSNERGTSVIVAIAEQLKKTFKDTSAIICRRTSDQFLILRRVDDGGPMRQIYNNDILPSIRDILGEKYNISMSFGNVIISNCDEKATTIVGQADNARGQGKHSHKTTFITFDAKMQKIYDDKINITFRMEQALKDKEFFVQYQPKVNFSTMEVDGAEALVRWKPKLGDVIYPDSFIPVFEDNGFISTLDLFVLEETCKFIKTNYKQVKIPRISVNLSAHTVLSDDVVNRISDIMDLHKILPKEIELELTESAIESDATTFLRRVNQLKKLGFPIAIDDFGAGVSSLNRLSAIEADVLKLDKAFFDLKEQGGKSTTIVADVVTMAKHLEMKVVAEGVETAAQALWLRGIKCDYAQGYYFAKPMGTDDFKELLASDKRFTI